MRYQLKHVWKLYHAACLLGVLLLSAQAAQWGSITIVDSTGGMHVVLENARMRAAYRPWKDENVIKELYLKGHDLNMAGFCVDACAGRKALTEAKVIGENGDKITARLLWGEHTTAEITLYRDSPVMKINQRSGNSPNIIDVSAGFRRIVVHGQQEWIRDINTYPQCYYYLNDDHCAKQNGDTTTTDGDPGPLLYNDWFILGTYNTQGLGFGRVIDKRVKVVKFLDWGGRGFELFWSNHLSYLFVTGGGGEELLRKGRQIADWANGGEQGLPLGEPPTALRTHRGSAPAPRPLSVEWVSSAGIRIHVEAKQQFVLEIYSLDGKLASRSSDSGPQSIFLPCSKGIYIISLKANGRHYRERIAMTP